MGRDGRTKKGNREFGEESRNISEMKLNQITFLTEEKSGRRQAFSKNRYIWTRLCQFYE